MLMSSSAENRKKVNSQIAGVRRLHSAFAIACTLYLCLLRGHYATGVGGWLGALHTFYLRPFEQGQYSLMWKFAPSLSRLFFFSRDFTTSCIDFQLRLRSTLNKSNYYSTGTREVLKCMCWTSKKHGLIFEPVQKEMIKYKAFSQLRHLDGCISLGKNTLLHKSI
jgi:hypothetical protein